jgi:hypothetical protein
MAHLDLAAKSVQPSNPGADGLWLVALLNVPCTEVAERDAVAARQDEVAR